MAYIRVGFSARRQGPRKEVRLLVDTGSFYSILPSKLVELLGVRPEWQEELEMANGEGMTRWVGRAYVHHATRSVETFVILGEGRDAPLLGAYALEGLGLEVDPRSSKVRPRRKTWMVAVSPG